MVETFRQLHLKITDIGAIVDVDIDITKREDRRNFLRSCSKCFKDTNIEYYTNYEQRLKCFTTGASAGMDFLSIVFSEH